jgi:serine/threonine-protein kinase
MSEVRDPRADETSFIPPDGAARETAAVDSSPPVTAVDAAAMAPTERMNPVERGPSVAEARGALSPGAGETMDMPAPGAGETKDMPAPGAGETMGMPAPGVDETVDVPPSVGSVGPGGGSATDAGSGAMPVFGGVEADATTDEATPAPAGGLGRPLPSGRRPGPPRPALPGYEIIEEIGRGGMGVVYKARHVRLNRLVALKMILAGAHASDDQIARFHIEARAVAQIQHPGIVQIYEDGDHEGLPYFSLEFVPGGSLSQAIGGKPQPPRSAATTVMALCRAMAEAHSRGIIHRDLKPANVLLTIDGQPKITDFGLARQMDEDSRQTRSGAIMGTPSYMAPEQAWGQTHEIGPLSDQYALGAILYDMLVGRPPFQGATTLETLELARTQEPVPPTRLQPNVPIDLETICLKALQKDPAKRYPDAAAMAEDLRRFLDGEPIVARPVGSLERLWRWCKRNPRVAILAAAVLLLMIFTAVGSAAFAASMKALNGKLEALNGKLARSVEEETKARQIAQSKEQAAIAAMRAEAEAREKAKALVQGALAQNRNALEAHRTLSVLLNQRLLSIPGTQGLREELIRTSLTGLEATIALLEQLGTVARDKEGFALATRTLAGINQRAGQIAMEYGKYDETARYFRRMDELARELAASDPDALEPVKVLAIVKATLAGFQMDKMGDAEAALRLFDEALALRRECLAREPSGDEAKRGVANMLGAIARAQLQLGNPAAARERYREEIRLRDQLSPALADQLEVRRERAGLEDKLGDLNLSLGDPTAGPSVSSGRSGSAGRWPRRTPRHPRRSTTC